MRRLIVILLLAIVILPSYCYAQSRRGPSTAEERQRAVLVAKNFEEDPLATANKKDREWLTMWLIEVPDITVSICGATLTWEKNYKYGGELMAAELGSMAKSAIEHPENTDKQAVGMSAMEAALNAYAKILQTNPKAHSKQMDEMVKLRDSGGLKDYLGKEWDKCK